jgi:hypothetical protein
MKNFIQLEGFTVSGSFRAYSFQVIVEGGESRRFIVKVALESFRTTPLKFQDGPLISRERVQQALDTETQDLQAKAQLAVGEPEIQAYMIKHYPPKARKWTYGKAALRTALE